ncbi:NUDIX domain-containing protein [Kribbella sp. NPDC051936]|uniref:NUDIX domain-containing protein n=1 Tax=Kribbella sp. NPDC051936 TaxID=3154946 RepID=UPI00343A8F97
MDSYLSGLRRDVGSRLLLLPGAQVLAIDPDDRILFQRSRDSGRWELPAGGAEPGDSFRRTAAREFTASPPAPLHPPTEVVLRLHAVYRGTGLFQAC